MRKIAILLGLVTLATVLFASAAYGVMRHQCAASPCTGTNSANYLDERPGNGTPDAIYGRGGRDDLDASYWTRDRDHLYGNNGKGTLNTNDGDTLDTVTRGPGYDTCIVTTRAEIGGSCVRVRVRQSP